MNGLLYVIERAPHDGKSLFDDIVNYLSASGLLKDPATNIIIEKNAIYFGYNLKEISILLEKFKSEILDHERHAEHSMLYDRRKLPPLKFNEYCLFEMDWLRPASGITIKPMRGSIFDIRKQKIKDIKQQNLSFDRSKVSQEKIVEDDHFSVDQQLSASLLSNNGVCIGELHNRHEAKQMLIAALPSLVKSGVTTLYVEFGFYDTQKNLYDSFNATGKLPSVLLSFIVTEDKLDKMIAVDNGNIIAAYQKNVYSYLGLVVMAKMQDVNITPIDHTDAYDSVLTSFYTKSEESFVKKRMLLMNYHCHEVSLKEKSEGKGIFFVGEEHSNFIEKLNIPGVSDLLNIPSLKVSEYQKIIECDAYTKGLLSHNIGRVLLGKPVKVYQPTKGFSLSDKNFDCRKLIFLQELKSEVDDPIWSTKGQFKFTFLSFKHLPSKIANLRKILANLDDCSSEKEITNVFNNVMNNVQSTREMYESSNEVETFCFDKSLQGMDIVDPDWRMSHYPETSPLNLSSESRSVITSKF